MRKLTMIDAAEEAIRSIPPMFPLSATVAVNPYLGQAHLDLASTGGLLARVGAGPITMPRSWFAKKMADGAISDEALVASIASSGHQGEALTPDLVKQALNTPAPARAALETIADLATDLSGTDWSGIITDRLGIWAGGYFDDGQALWSAEKQRGAYAAWREVATHDLMPEIMGLAGFARFVADAPQSAETAIQRSTKVLDLSLEAAPTYFHRLMQSMGGWAQLARWRGFNAELVGGTDKTALDLLAIRLLWEEALFLQHRADMTDAWATLCTAYTDPVHVDLDLVIDAVLQEAFERTQQGRLAQTLASTTALGRRARPTLQAAFCIDVRSEVFRRALESQDSSIETIGFAGFFGLSVEHKSFASDVAELRHPVLVNSQIRSKSGGEKDLEADQNRRFLKRAKRAWGRFKLAAVSSFAFVEATGPMYAVKLVRDALGAPSGAAPKDPAPRLDGAISFEQQVDAAETILRAMSLTDGFAKIVMMVGHGADATNNAQLSALQCGACGGHSGEVNARLLALLLNNKNVREALVERSISIPEDTMFVGALHNTTADTVTLFDSDGGVSKTPDLARAKEWLEAAGVMARTERLVRLPNVADQGAIAKRTKDWAEVRPEWGLAGCSAFIAAPRQRTVGKNLSGQTFLHDYAWKSDTDFAVLELILTAPVVVASWISLQYYGSTVAGETFGSGNKLLHNVVGGVGVLEGNGGLLRTGLAKQSVHDGDKVVHEPLRLSVCIEAPEEAITGILDKHPGVRALFDNRWLHLFTLNDAGYMASRYVGDLTWEPFEAGEPMEQAA